LPKLSTEAYARGGFKGSTSSPKKNLAKILNAVKD